MILLKRTWYESCQVCTLQRGDAKHCLWVRSRHHGDPDRRARRAIANSNERRRMQSINAGFQSLHELVKPRHGEKLSKVRLPPSPSLSLSLLVQFLSGALIN